MDQLREEIIVNLLKNMHEYFYYDDTGIIKDNIYINF